MQRRHPLEPFRTRFEALEWSRGLTLEDIRSLAADLPPGVQGSIPDNQRFRSFEEFWDATRAAPAGSGGGMATGAVNVGGNYATSLDPEAPTNSDV